MSPSRCCCKVGWGKVVWGWCGRVVTIRGAMNRLGSSAPMWRAPELTPSPALLPVSLLRRAEVVVVALASSVRPRRPSDLLDRFQPPSTGGNGPGLGVAGLSALQLLSS